MMCVRDFHSDLVLCDVYVFFFFFQAEDGIRDLTVTGVQTCALPISATLTGGFNGRSAPTFRVPGLTFNDGPPTYYVFNVKFGRDERLWYLFLVLLEIGRASCRERV